MFGRNLEKQLRIKCGNDESVSNLVLYIVNAVSLFFDSVLFSVAGPNTVM